MTDIWLGLSMLHLQAYPSRTHMLFSQRKDNVPKRCFPDNNLGQESSTALPSALCQETRSTVLNRSFSRFKLAKSYLHNACSFLSPTRNTRQWHCFQWIGNSLIHFHRPLLALKGMVVLVVWYSYLCELSTLSWWPLKPRNCWKLKLDCLKAYNCSETVTKHMTSPFTINSWQALCWNAPKYLGVWIFTLWNQNLEPLPPTHCSFIPLQYWHKCHHLKHPTSLGHHHMMPNITTRCPNDVMLFLVGIQCACAWYAEQKSSLRAWTPKQTLSSTSHGDKAVTLGTYHDIYTSFKFLRSKTLHQS